ncbi:MAG: DNA primase [Candidatus Levybacteria bacterium]|nr:DNA primase [Candidatus Levybacteria bacterium]
MDQASQVKEKIDIVSLISEYLPLKKMGRNFTTVCPFHSENSSSFVVSPERQIWHCFGCGKGGDAFSFLMDYENLEFVESLRILAKKAGVTLNITSNSFATSRKEAIYSLNKIAAEYYHFVLTKHPVGEKALLYLIKNRNINEKLIKTFQIGFAPSRGEDLSKYLLDKKKFKKMDLVEAGLGIQKGERVIDFFRGRIIFPLIDHRGNISGFSGRNITEADFGPKYINTRDTLVYHKGSMFFGLNLAKDSIKKEQSTIVMEGEFDVITAFKEGITNAVALKGTALTENQAILLSRFAPKVSLCLDQDNAGIEAMKRSIPVLEKRGLSITVIIPDEKDPDEALKSNPVGFKKAIKNDREIYDFLLDKFVLENDSDSAIGKKKIGDEMLPLISNIQNEIIKEHYLKKLSEAISTSYDSLLRQIENKTTEKEEKIAPKIQKQNRHELLEEYLLGLVIQGIEPKQMLIKVQDILNKYEFFIPSVGKIFAEILTVVNAKDFDLKSASKNLSSELLPVFDKCFLMPLPKFEDNIKYEEEIIRVSKDLKLIQLKEKIKQISRDLKGKEENEEEIEKIKEEIASITSQIVSS